MLIEPLNDRECLQQLQGSVRRLITLPTVRARADEYHSLDDVAEGIRHRPQRDDVGDPSDGPRLACAVSQRARHNAWDPNCFERTIDYLTYAEIIDPHTERTCATAIVNDKWHTFPVEIRNRLPRIVVLDPYDTPPLRNTMLATAYEARNVAIGAREVLVPWYLDMARNACIDDGAEESFDQAIGALRCGLTTGEPMPAWSRVDLDFVMDLAARDANLWRHRGCKAADRVQRSIRNFSLGLEQGRVAGFLRELARTGEQLAPHALRMALTAQFGPAAALALDGVTLAMEPTPTQPGQPVLTVAPDDQDERGDSAALEQAHGSRPQTALGAARKMSLGFLIN